MELLKLNTKLTSTEMSSLKYMTASLILVLLYQTFHMLFNARTMLLFDIAIIFLGAIGCWKYLSKLPLKSYSRFFIFLTFYFLIVGFLYGDNIMSEGNLSITLEQDLRYVLLVIMGGVFASSSNMMACFHWLMKWLAVISIVFGILALLSFDFVASVIQNREGTWTSSYYYWWASCACFSYWGYYALFTKQHKYLGIGVLVTYVVIGALFVKRASLLNGIIILLFYTLFDKTRKISAIFKGALIAVLTVAMLYFISPDLFSTITNSYSSRIDSARDIDAMDRNEEAYAYLEHATPMQLVFGNGIGHYPNIMGYRDYDYQINAIHIGWANIIYKGGVVYALFYLLLLFQVLKKISHSSQLNKYQLACLGVSVSSFVSIIYEGSWTYALEPVCIFAPMFYLLSNNQDEFV